MLNETCDLYVHLYKALTVFCGLVSALLLHIAGGGRHSGEIKGLCLN